MNEELKNLQGQMKILNDLQKNIGSVNMSSPETILESLGIDLEKMDEYYQETVQQDINRKILVEYVNGSENKEPSYAYESDSGFDLRSTEDLWVQANSRLLVPTGLRFDIPENYEIQVRSKSGLALNQGLMVLNSPGTVDCGYQGEIKVIIFNTTNERIKIEKGQKIAQAVISPVLSGKWVNLVKVEDLKEKDRNDKGFGSTGL